MNVACCQASYLTLMASYQNKKENENVIANSAESYPYKRNISVVILAVTPECVEGNHPDTHKDLSVNSFTTTKSIQTLISCIAAQTISGTVNGGKIFPRVSICAKCSNTKTLSEFSLYIRNNDIK